MPLKSHRDDDQRNSKNNNNGNTQTFGAPQFNAIGKLHFPSQQFTQHDPPRKHGRGKFSLENIDFC